MYTFEKITQHETNGGENGHVYKSQHAHAAIFTPSPLPSGVDLSLQTGVLGAAFATTSHERPVELDPAQAALLSNCTCKESKLYPSCSDHADLDALPTFNAVGDLAATGLS